MQLEKIKEFYKLREAYFAKKAEIAKALDELQWIKDDAKEAMSNTIDNGFEEPYMLEVASRYDAKKFNSKCVQGFLQKVDEMFLSNIDAKLKENLEVTDIKIRTSIDYASYESYSSGLHIDGPIEISFIDVATDRSFQLVIPLKCSSKANLDVWNDSKCGLYQVFSSVSDSREKMICCTFDSAKIATALSMFLSGKLDDEIKSDIFIANGQVCQAWYNPDFKINVIDDYDGMHTTVSRKWNTSDSYFTGNNVVPSCVNDIEETFAKCVES